MKNNSGFLKHDQRGITLVEILVAITLFSIMSLSVLNSRISSVRAANQNLYKAYAMELALDKLEEFAGFDPASISADYVDVETVTFESYAFTRTTTVTINADRTRTASVNVAADNSPFPAEVTVANSYPLWGKR